MSGKEKASNNKDSKSSARKGIYSMTKSGKEQITENTDLYEQIKNDYNKTKEYPILLEFLESKDIMKDYNEEKEDLINFMEEQLKRGLKPEFEEFKKVKKLETQQKRLNTLIEQRKEAYNKFKSNLKGKTIDGKTIENINKTALGLTSKQEALVELKTLEQLNKELDEQLEEKKQ